MSPAIENGTLIARIPPPERPGHFLNEIVDPLLERAALAGSMAQPPISIRPLAPDLPPVNVVGGHAVLLLEFLLIE